MIFTIPTTYIIELIIHRNFWIVIFGGRNVITETMEFSDLFIQLHKNIFIH